jgi:hypothetical protein
MSEPAAVGTLEHGPTARVLDDPQDPYTQRLRQRAAAGLETEAPGARCRGGTDAS